jgi:hypothetical protein
VYGVPVTTAEEFRVYKTGARMLIRRNIGLLNQGRYGPALSMFAPNATLTFPGRNSFSSEHREPQMGRDAYPTHRGGTPNECPRSTNGSVVPTQQTGGRARPQVCESLGVARRWVGCGLGGS